MFCPAVPGALWLPPSVCAEYAPRFRGRDGRVPPALDGGYLVLAVEPPRRTTLTGAPNRSSAGIFHGMISQTEPDDVVNELGDKVVGAIVHAVEVAKEQYLQYRRQHPDWAADNAPRTLADLIHDWMWADLKQQLDELPHVNLIDQNSTREIVVQVQSEERLSYRFRVKLHHLDGRTSNYQTQSVIDFDRQDIKPTLPRCGETRLKAGYEWDKETRTMGDPVISLRDGRDKIIWVHPLAEQGEAYGGTVTRPPNRDRPCLSWMCRGPSPTTQREPRRHERPRRSDHHSSSRTRAHSSAARPHDRGNSTGATSVRARSPRA